MTTRTDLLNFLARRYNLTRYLEIGVQNPENNFNNIECGLKISVDPDPSARASFPWTSDIFFEQIQHTFPNICRLINEGFPSTDMKFDLIFIDGLHHADQVQKDFFNASKILSDGGFIVLHDCNPPQEQFTHVPRDSKVWFGDVYKFATQFSLNRYFNTVDIDCGCGVFKKTMNHTITGEEITWDYFDKNRERLLRLISPEEFLKIHT